LWATQARHKHLRQADIFCPGNSILLIMTEFLDSEVRTYAGKTRVAENLLELGAFVLGEPTETIVGIANGRTQLHGLKASLGKYLERAGKVFGDHVPHRPGLAPDRHTQGIGTEFHNTS